MPCAAAQPPAHRHALTQEQMPRVLPSSDGGRFCIVPANGTHLNRVRENIRQQDAQELLLLEACAGGSRSVGELLETSFHASSQCLALLEAETCLGVGGFVPLSGDVHGWVCPWFVGTKGLEGNAAAFRAVSRYYSQYISGNYPRMMNLVHAAPGNAAPAWLERLGFTLRPLVPSGAVDALPEKMREVCQDIKVFFRDTACAAGRVSSNCSS